MCGEPLTVSVVVAALVTLPLESATAEPKFVPSTTNCTVPVGVPVLPLELSATVAVKVTDWPKVDGLTEDVTVVVVDA